MSIHPWWRLAAEKPVAPARKRPVSWLAAVLVLFAAATQAGTLSPQRLVEVADLSSPVVSPAGTHVAFRMEQASVGRNTYDCFWYVQALDTAAAPLRVADCGIVLRDSAAQPLPALMRWSPDGAWIYFLAMLEGRVDVWRAAADGSGASALTHDHADVIEFALSSDGKQLSYRVGASREQVSRAELEEYQKGVRVDASLPVGQGVFRSGMVGGRPATQRLDTWFDRVPLLANAPRQWKVIELASGVQRDLAASQLPPKPLEVSDLQSRWPDVWKLEQQPSSGKVAVLIRQGERGGYRDRPEVQLSVLANARSQQPIPCISPLCTGKAITRMQWLPGGDELLYAVTRREQGQAQSLYRWNVRTGQVDEVASSSGLLSGGRDQNSPCGASADTLVCVAAEAGRPPYLVSLGLKKPSTRVLFEPNQRLAQDISRTMPVRLLQWKDEQGESFSGQFYPAQQVPEGGAPLFITYYTCPGFVRGGLGDEWPLLSLAERGISALCINAAPYRLDASSRYGAGLSAVESVVKLLASEGKVDRTRVGMGGLSFGTEMTLWTMMHSDLLAAASIASPGISRQYYLLGSLRGDIFFAGLQRSWQAAAPEKTPERWQLLSPDMNLDRFRAPLLMQLSEQEYIFTLDFSIPLVRDQRADMYLFPNEPHQKFQPQHKLAVYERNLDWFSYWLTGYEDPAAAKVDQYRHWQSMKTRFEAERGQRR